jgi:hypothetical protein
MITSLFRKSTPLNYSIIVLGFIFSFFIIQIQLNSDSKTSVNWFEKAIILMVVFGSVFTTNFIIKKNQLSKDSAYTVLFYLLFMLFIPNVWNNLNLLIANFFVLLAIRRLISLHSPKTPKEKIFDASLWIFVATVFHFWCISYLLLVFISILFHTARDYRSWFLPFIAFVAIASVFVFAALFFQTSWISELIQNSAVNFKIDYFQTQYQNLALSIYASIALFFVVSMVFSLSNRPLILHSSYKKIITAFLIGVFVFVISPNKSNDLLIFTIAPLSIMATSHVEMTQFKLQKDIVLFVAIICSLYVFYSQL